MYWNNSYINVRNVRIQDCWGAHFVLVWSLSSRQPFPFLIPHFPRPSPTLSSFMVVLCIFTRRSRLIKGGSTSHTWKKNVKLYLYWICTCSLTRCEVNKDRLTYISLRTSINDPVRVSYPRFFDLFLMILPVPTRSYI